MTQHLPADDRKGQIIEAALSLLAEVSIDRLTTRDVAERVGVTQPALFRHFESRDALLEAVAEATRQRLGSRVNELLERGGNSLETLSSLSRELFRFAAENPGVPRLLFFDAARGNQAGYHLPLRHLVTMQRSLVSELVSGAQKEGELAETVDPEAAATMFVALIQGLLLQWQHLDDSLDPDASAAQMAAFFLAALRGGEPAGGKREAESGQQNETLLSLDVRPILARGDDPLGQILAALKRLAPAGALLLTAPFRPAPLLTLLKSRGFVCECGEVASGDWFVIAEPGESPGILELRDLEAPEPMEQVLLHASRLEGGQFLLARLPRVPKLLLPHLEQRGLAFTVAEVPDGSALLCVRRED
ncbi:MAG: DUF2249 domain-containing protein [Planctomycetota bacterium]